mgnify:CR=1 FL=1
MSNDIPMLRNIAAFVLPAVYLIMHVTTWRRVVTSKGMALNLLVFGLMLLAIADFCS